MTIQQTAKNQIREMFILGQAIFLEGIEKLKKNRIDRHNFIHIRSQIIIRKRMAVVEFVHGLELILKAVLLKKGYNIYKFKSDTLIKKPMLSKELIDEDKTVELYQVIRFFKKEHNNIPLDSIDTLRKLRNQIIHRGTQIGKKKRHLFTDTIICLNEIYAKNKINHRKFLNSINGSIDHF